jgi:hypothetical protein
MKLKPIIIIPIYKATLTEPEKASLIQCCKILDKHDISLVCPDSLDVKEYTHILDAYKVNHRVERFDDRFFRSTETYNLLMLDVDLYKRFNHYDFMLVYQLDAYVFRDDLDHWCEQGYDFIGAPWNRFDLLRNKMHLLEGGVNGGLSLRKINSFIKVLEDVAALGTAGKIMEDHIKSGRNEDGFYSSRAREIDPSFRVAPFDVAAHFSFERKPRKLYKMIGGNLPFGCHAWMRYDPKFWKEFIIS